MERLIQQPGYTYTVRRSQRARYAQIKITPAGVVTIVIPQRYSLKYIPEILDAHHEWIETQLKIIKANFNPITDSERPQKIILNAIGEEWSVEYGAAPRSRASQLSRARVDESHKRIYISANDDAIKNQLTRWLNRKARLMLTHRTAEISAQTQLCYAAVSVRNQRTRWGSCSVKKNISLNRNLIFLPAKNVRYLILHELCHTVYMNHSRRFWQLLEGFEPEYRQLDKSLNAAKRLIPYWALPTA